VNRAEEFEEKLSRVRTCLSEEGAAGVLLRTRANISWLGSGPPDNLPLDLVQGSRSEVWWQSDFGVLSFIVTEQSVVLVTENIELPRLVRDEFADLPIEVYSQPWHESDLGLALSNIFNDKDVVLTDFSDWTLMESCSKYGFSLRAVMEKLTALRASLLPRERDRYRWLGQHAARVMTEVCGLIRPGISEVEIVAESHYRLRRLGIAQEVDIVCGDNRIDVDRHGLYSDRTIEQVAMVVFCAHKWGQVANLTRMVHVGKVSSTLASQHADLTHFDCVLMRATAPGVALRDIFTGVIEPGYASMGAVDEWRNHHQGGSTGYSGRDLRVTPTSAGVVQQDQAFAWNPSLPGLKAEDTFVATSDGPELLTIDGNWPAYRENGRARILEL